MNNGLGMMVTYELIKSDHNNFKQYKRHVCRF